MAAKRMPTTTGPAYGRTAFSNDRPTSPLAGKTSTTATTAPAAAARLDPLENDWYAGIRDLPTGPLSRKDLSEKIAAGDVNGDTLVWREGYADWIPLRTVSSLKDLLPPPVRIVPSRPPPAPAATREEHPALSDEDEDDAVTRVSDAGAALLAAIEGQKPEAFNPEATMLDVGPMQRFAEERAQKPTEPAKFDPESTIAETPSSRLAVAGALAKKPSEPPLDTTLRETKPRVEKPSQPPAPRVSHAPPPPPKAPEIVAPEPLRAEPLTTSAPRVNAPSLSATPDVPRVVEEQPRAVSVPPPPAAPSIPPPVATPAVVATVAADHDEHLKEFEFPPLASSTSLVPPVAVQERAPSRRGGLPGVAWVMVAGVLVVGVAGGIAISRRGTPQPVMNTANAATTTEHPTPVAPPAPQSAVTAPSIPTSETTAPTTEPTEPNVAAAGVAGSGDSEDPESSSRHHRSTHTRRGNELSAADRAYLNSQLAGMAGMGGGSGGGPVVTTPTTVAARSQGSSTGGSSASPEPSSRPRDTVRQQTVQQALERSGIVRRCWDQLLRRNPATELRTLPMTLHVNAEGTVTRIDVHDTTEQSMVSCIQLNTRSIRSVGPGSALDVQSSPRLDR